MYSRLDEARRIFSTQYPRGMHIMTPEFVKLDMFTNVNGVGGLAYEVSKGRGIDDETIYGVTTVELLPDGTTRRRCDLSGLCFTMGQVREKIGCIAQVANLPIPAIKEWDEP